MQAPFDNIVQHLFHQPSLHSVTVDELENMAQQHPYFAAAHFLLLKKMQDTDHPQFNTQLHKTTLYFNNPLWLQYLLQPETVADFKVSDRTPFISDEPAMPAAIEENENGYTNGHATATAYQLKEEEVLQEKEQALLTIEEPVVHQEADNKSSTHPAGGIMDVITEVFHEEPGNNTHLPVYEQPTINETPDIHIAESITDNNEPEAVLNDENAPIADTTVGLSEEKQIPETEESVEPGYTTAGSENNTAFFQEELTEQLVENGKEVQDSDEAQHTIEEENLATENEFVGEAAHENHVTGNNIIEAHTESFPEEIAAEPNTASTEETPVFANEETIVSVADTPTDTQILVDESQSPLQKEEITADSFNEDVTSSVIATIEENNAVANFQNEEISANKPEEITTDQAHVEEPAKENSSTAIGETTGAQNADDTDNAGVSTDAAPEKEQPLFRTIIETPASKHDFLFEPYHTVDYFASQGIKLSKVEANSKDKLGRQLKSFTEWLKSMKKLPQASIDKILSENEESKVVADAFHSIEKKDVITEAMAEVLEKQGMVIEAAGIYQKLSLLNPAKSAYFAAKIEALKH